MSLQYFTDYYAGPFAAVVLLTMLFSTELGFLFGRKHPVDEKSFTMLGVLQGAVLGTVALLLGFTFSLAASRYELRRELMVEESNAIGTTYLRTALITPERGAELRELLKGYLEQRIQRVHTISNDPKFAEITRDTLRTQIKMWRIAAKEGREYPNESTALLLDGLNKTIDISQAQFAAKKNRVPSSGLVILSIAAVVSALVLGYGFGICKRRLFGASLIFCMLVSAVIYVIIDFDRPNRGVVRVPDEMLRTLHAEMSQAIERERRGIVKP